MQYIHSMDRLSTAQRRSVIASLVEGNSMCATVRMTGVAKNTVAKLLVDMGTVCSIYQDCAMRDLTCERIQCDEIWSFCYAKKRNVPNDKKGEFGYGDVWTWIGMGADTKLVASYRVRCPWPRRCRRVHARPCRTAPRAHPTHDRRPLAVPAVRAERVQG